MGGVRGILLDSSVLFDTNNDDGNPNGNGKESLSFLPGADYILRKLHYSKIPTGISYGPDISAPKVSLFEKMARLYSFDCFILNPSSIDDTVNEISVAWADNGGSFLHLVSSHNTELFLKLSNCGWMIVTLGSSSGENLSMLFIEKLQELPLTICRLNRKATTGKDNVTVGYIMKPSREEDFAKRGAFPLFPTQNGLIFMPLTFELPISSQLQQVDIVLHKATDEIISIEMSSSSAFSNVTYTIGMEELKRYIEHQQSFCVIDPFDTIFPVLDRLKIQQILLGLDNFNTEGRRKIRAPHFLKVDDFNAPNLIERLVEARLSLPNIVKPQVACGVADAHSMAIVFRVHDYKGLSVPLPAVVQEYVDHSSSLFKFYVLGEKVFYAVKKSTPNADTLMKLSERSGLKPLLFDSLKSLPIAEENHHIGDGNCNRANHQLIDIALVTDAAGWLRRKLDLTIFGFDVVIQEGTGDHVIVDVNYLPSFKEVPDDVAIPAFWEAIKMKYESTKTKQATVST